MLIKFYEDDPKFQQEIELLKLKFRTFAAAKVVRRVVYDYGQLEKENELLVAQSESMTAEIDRLRNLLAIVSKDKYRY